MPALISFLFFNVFLQSWASFLPYGYHPNPALLKGKKKKDGTPYKRPGVEVIEEAKHKFFIFAVNQLRLWDSWHKFQNELTNMDTEDSAAAASEDVGEAEDGGEAAEEEEQPMVGGAHFAEWSFSDFNSGAWPFGKTGADLIIADAVYGQPGEATKFVYGPPGAEPERAWGEHEFKSLFEVRATR